MILVFVWIIFFFIIEQVIKIQLSDEWIIFIILSKDAFVECTKTMVVFHDSLKDILMLLAGRKHNWNVENFWSRIV